MTASLLAPKWRKKITSKKAESYEAGVWGGVLWTSERCGNVSPLPPSVPGCGIKCWALKIKKPQRKNNNKT